MTQTRADSAAAARRRLAGLTLLAAAAVASAARAEVTLETAVSKVESTLEADGRVRRELVPAEQVVPGEELRYTITFANDSDMVVDAGRIVITNPVPDGTLYVAGSAGGDAALVEYSTDGESFAAAEPPGETPGEPGASASGASTAAAAPTGDRPAGQPDASEDAASSVRSLRWTYQRPLAPGQRGAVYFHVRMQ